jgi:hypothetical protein
MVGAGRFELPTPGPPDRCANRAALRSDVGNQALQGAGGKNKQWFATGLPPELGYQRGILFTEKPCQHGGPQLPNCARCYRFIRAGAAPIQAGSLTEACSFISTGRDWRPAPQESAGAKVHRLTIEKKIELQCSYATAMEKVLSDPANAALKREFARSP